MGHSQTRQVMEELLVPKGFVSKPLGYKTSQRVSSGLSLSCTTATEIERRFSRGDGRAILVTMSHNF